MKRKLALLLSAAILIPLSACSANNSADSEAPAGDAAACSVKSGKISESVKVSGEHADTVTAEFKTPLAKSKEMQATAVYSGEGNKVVASEDVTYNLVLTAYNGANGEQLFAQAGQSTFAQNATIPFMTEAAGCVTDKGRLVLTMPAGDVWEDPATVGLTDFTAEDTLVLVADFNGVVKTLSEDELLGQAEGKEVKLPEGFPEVEIAENGEPTITIPEGLAAPTELKIANMVEGEGETVEPGAEVYVHYRGVIWSTGEEFDSSWSRGSHTSFKTNEVIEGFQKALEGQKVGSRVVALVTPDAGYGASGLTQMGHKEDDVMVFVLDVLGVVNP